MVGIVVVSHSSELARGRGRARGPDGRPRRARSSAPAAPPTASLGTDEGRVRDAIRRADHGDGVVVLGDLGSAILTIRHVLERTARQRPREAGRRPARRRRGRGRRHGVRRLPPLDDVVRAAEEARDARKL